MDKLEQDFVGGSYTPFKGEGFDSVCSSQPPEAEKPKHQLQHKKRKIKSEESLAVIRLYRPLTKMVDLRSLSPVV